MKPVLVSTRDVPAPKNSGLLLNAYMLHNLAHLEPNAVDLAWDTRLAELGFSYAGAIFADARLKGLNGAPDIVECSFVQSSVTELPFFASKVKLGRNRIEEVQGLGSLSDFEKEGLENLKAELKSSIEKGIKFVNEN